MVPTVLLFNLENDKGRKIKALCLALKLRARSVPPEDFSQPIEAPVLVQRPDGSFGRCPSRRNPPLQ